jgi:hypothetical protein
MTSDEDTVRQLRSAMALAARGHRLDPAAAEDAWAAARGSRGSSRWAVAASVALVLALAAGLAAVRATNRPSRNAAAAPSCALSTAPLPAWARDGFTPSAYRTPHVVGAAGQIVAVPFAQPLRVHQPAGRNNKVLWQARVPGAPLVVHARLGTRLVTRTLPDGTGPSYLNLPAPGCWQLTLHWPGHRDSLALRYAP